VKLRIPLWATFYTVIALIILISLGVWQVKRLAWKNDILSRIDAEFAVDARSVAIDPSVDLSVDLIKKGYLKGRFLHDKAILIQSRVYKGYQGHHLITPFEMVDFNDRVVFVNRGWVPLGIDVMNKDIDKPEGLIMITGFLRRPFDGNKFTPENIADKDQWYSIKPDEIAKAKGISKFYSNVFYKGALNKTRGVQDMPIAASTKIKITNNHAGYALFWFLMALVLTVIYLLKFIAPQFRVQFK